MRGTSIHLDHLRGRVAAARIVDGSLDDLVVAPDEGIPLPGAIYRCVVDRAMKGQGGAIVRLPNDTGFLRKAAGLRPGQSLLVQITGFAEEGKAVPVRSDPLLTSRNVIVTPGRPGVNLSRRIRNEATRQRLQQLVDGLADGLRSNGLIVRSAAAEATDEEIARDTTAMMDCADRLDADNGSEPILLFDGPDPHMIARREWPRPAALYTDPENFVVHGVDEMVADLANPRVDLTDGHWFSVEPTRALVAIDVNTGADTSAAAGLKANIACARRLPVELRCRGLGGQIVVDMAPVPKTQRRTVDQALTAAFRADPVNTTIAGWTRLGHVELHRRRERLPLHKVLGR